MADSMASNPYMFKEEEEENPENAFYAALGNEPAEASSQPPSSYDDMVSRMNQTTSNAQSQLDSAQQPQAGANPQNIPAQPMQPMANTNSGSGGNSGGAADFEDINNLPGPDMIGPVGGGPQGGYIGEAPPLSVAQGTGSAGLPAGEFNWQSGSPEPFASSDRGQLDVPDSAYMGQGAYGYGSQYSGQETYLEPYIQNLLENTQNQAQVELTGPSAIEVDAIKAGTPMGSASVGDYNLFKGAQIDPAQTMQAQQMGQAQSPDAARVAPVDAMRFANLSPEDQRAQTAQQQQLAALQAMAGGEMSSVVQQQRDRGTQDVLAMMATQRGTPAAATMRAGMQGMADVDRQAQETASQQQLGALQALGGAATQVRGQDIDVASQQAQMEQQAMGSTFEAERQAAMANAGFTQEASQSMAQRDQQTEAQNAQLRQDASMQNMQSLNQRAAQQAEMLQQAGIQGNDLATQTAIQDSVYAQEAERMNFEANESRLRATADFQNAANMNDAELEQAMTIAEAQVNAQLEGTRANLVNALVGQGVDRYKAELQANSEAQLQYNQLMKDYFAIRQGAIVELGSQIIDEAWFWQTPTSAINDHLGLFNDMIGTPSTGAMTGPYSPGGYNMGQGSESWNFGSEGYSYGVPLEAQTSSDVVSEMENINSGVTATDGMA